MRHERPTAWAKTIKTIKTTAAVGLVMSILGAGLPRAEAIPSAYTVTDLGTLPDTSSSEARAINESGQIAGISGIGNASQAFRYSGGVMTNLGSLGALPSYGQGINNSGQVTGHSTTSGNSHAYLWTSGGTDGPPFNPQMKDLGTLTGGTISLSRGVNANGQVAGMATTVGGGTQHAMRYSGGVMTDLGTLGGTLSEGHAINASGQITGWARTIGNSSRAFIWTPDGTDGVPSNPQMKQLNPVPGRGLGEGRAINTSGEVVGRSYTSGTDPRATLFRNPPLSGIDLGTLGGSFSEAHGINDDGNITGWADIADDTDHAFLSSGGVMSDLNDLIAPGSGWVLTRGNDINNRGQIVGFGTIGGQTHGFLLSPKAPGDANCDGVVDSSDVQPFALALLSPTAYTAAYPGCNIMNSDVNGDSALSDVDIDPFVICLLTGSCP